MRIYSMTATFGKLEHETLTLEPGLNILQAPNEWGKSTWCAFLTAMLYGVETRSHTTKTVLADKERYAPWSGSPMSGSIRLSWQGRDITIQRRTKGRIPLGEFQAFETHTGLAVPELTAANCGQQLLGVEKSVFQQAGFIRLSDMSVAGDEHLRRRLNALVTTGDESGTAERLAQKLRELKNRCRSNKTTGLLPQAQEKQAQLRGKLQTLHSLQHKAAELSLQRTALQAQKEDLENHLCALEYDADRENARRLTEARGQLRAVAEKKVRLEEACAQLPEEAELEQRLTGMRQLRSRQEALRAELLGLKAPEAPTAAVFTEAEAERDRRAFRRAGAWGVILLVLALLTLGVGAVLWYMGTLQWILLAVAAGALILLGTGIGLLVRRRKLRRKHSRLPPGEWVKAARRSQRLLQLRETYLRCRNSLEAQLFDLEQELREEAERMSEHQLLHAGQLRQELAQARREFDAAQSLEAALRHASKHAAPPKKQDTLTYSYSETQSRLAFCTRQLEQVHLFLGNCQGQIDILGQESALQQALEAENRRVSELEETLLAVELAQAALQDATQQLQRRFAPRIASRAQSLFQRLTGNRYDRIKLESDLSLSAAARDEDTLRTYLWRSEGTVDQLYLALRLAVAAELTPQAPLILDDALVRFDDTRLAAAMQILREEAASKQVIVFTCQSRERLLAE